MTPNAASQPLRLDPTTQKRVRDRLHRLGGQVSGIERMIEEQRSSADVLMQIASLRQAANGLAAELLQAHIAQCVQTSLDKGQAPALESIQAAIRSVLRHS